MYCSKCGKEISDQAKFCNYCGEQVNTARTQPEHQPQARPAEQPKPAKKKGKAGKRILSILLAVVVYFVVRYATESMMTGKNSAADLVKNVKEAVTGNSDVEDAMDSCARGAIFENGYLRYGMTRIYMPNYKVLIDDEQERDWLTAPQQNILFTAYKQNEILEISFDASDEAGMLKSFQNTYSDAEMLDYRKYEVNGFPVIRYIVAYTANDVYQYQGELIVFPSKTTKETIRMTMFVNVAAGFGTSDINQAFNTLEVSPEFKVTEADTNVIGFNRITEK